MNGEFGFSYGEFWLTNNILQKLKTKIHQQSI